MTLPGSAFTSSTKVTPFGKEENSGNDESELLHPANKKEKIQTTRLFSSHLLKTNRNTTQQAMNNAAPYQSKSSKMQGVRLNAANLPLNRVGHQ